MALNLSMPVPVVDDYGTMTRIIRNLHKQNIDEASNGAAALAKMRAKRHLRLEYAADERL